ncbi:MAG: hypothetical protein BGN86_11705 [Caulobacterales bacterium 68-7]|nr:MAG: hypothetical protein BGN86_11705 [Caulobacterales bacterium 68-7]
MTMSQVMTPLLATVLQEGIDQGSFRIRDAHAVAEMIVHLEGSMHSALVSAADVEGGVSGSLGETRVLRRAAQVGIAIDRLLGLPDHTVVFVPPGQEQAQL